MTPGYLLVYLVFAGTMGSGSQNAGTLVLSNSFFVLAVSLVLLIVRKTFRGKSRARGQHYL